MCFASRLRGAYLLLIPVESKSFLTCRFSSNIPLASDTEGKPFSRRWDLAMRLHSGTVCFSKLMVKILVPIGFSIEKWCALWYDSYTLILHFHYNILTFFARLLNYIIFKYYFFTRYILVLSRVQNLWWRSLEKLFGKFNCRDCKSKLNKSNRKFWINSVV